MEDSFLSIRRYLKRYDIGGKLIGKYENCKFEFREDAAYNPIEKRLYITSFYDRIVNVYDENINKLFSFPTNIQQITGILYHKNMICVDSCNWHNKIKVYDPNGNFLREIKKPEVYKKIKTDGEKIYVDERWKKRICAFDDEKDEYKYIIENLKDPYDIEVSGKLLYVVDAEKVKIFDLDGKYQQTLKFEENVEEILVIDNVMVVLMDEKIVLYKMTIE